MMETVTEVLHSGLGAVILAAWRGLPLLLVVLLISLIGKHWIAPRFQRWLWMLVVVRLLLPVSVESPFSLAAPMDALASRIGSACWPAPPPPKAQQSFVFADGTEVVQPPLPIHSDTEGVVALPPSPYQASPSEWHTASLSWQEILINCIAGVWATVAFFLTLRSVIAHWRFSRLLRSAPAIVDDALMSEVARVCQQMRIARCPRVVQLSSLAAPAVFGWWKPVLCFPARDAVELSRQELNWVLRHELAHVKYRDALFLTLVSFMKAIHWFNPIAWIVEAKLKEAIEQAADAAVMRDLNPPSATEYGRLLLRYAAAQSDVALPRLVGLLSMAASSGLKGRIAALGSRHAQSWSARLAMLVLLASVAATGLTDAATVAVYRLRDVAVPLHVGPEKQPRPPQRQRVSIDVRGVLAKAAQLQPGIDAESFVASYFTFYSPTDNSPTITDGILSADLSDFEARTVKQRLRAFERSGPWQISVECRLVEADLKLAESFAWNSSDVKLVTLDSSMSFEHALVGQLDRWDELLLDESASNVLTGTYKPDAMRPVLAAKLTEDQIRTFVRACDSDPRGNILQAPRVTCFNGQIISLTSAVERPFVTNVAVVPDSPKGILQPTIETVAEGWAARLSVEATEDGAVDLACILRESKITDVELANLPIRSPDNPESDVIVQVPNVQRVSAGSQTRLQAGESLAIAVPRTFRDHTEPARPPAMFYVFTPRLISDAQVLSYFVTK
ncbi:MAG: M56 family metallopeptidase [Aureliella sp.]